MDNYFRMLAVTCPHWSFLGLKPWYAYLTLAPDSTGACSVGFNSPSDFLLILLALVDDLLIVAGLVAVIFVIYGGIRYITSQGSPDATGQAMSTIIYSLIGLAIAVIAIPTVSYLGNNLGTGNGSSNVPVTNNATLNLHSLPNPAGAVNGGTLTTILQDTFGIIGALSLLFIVIGGFRYILSSGDPQNTALAKGTVLYAIVGLLISIVAESIVSLVLGKL